MVKKGQSEESLWQKKSFVSWTGVAIHEPTQMIKLHKLNTHKQGSIIKIGETK